METDAAKLKGSLESLVDNLLKVRRLVKPSVDAVGNADGFSRVISKNYQTISSLCEENDHFLKETLYPLLESEEELSDELSRVLDRFCDLLFTSWPEEDIDLSLLFLTTKRLFSDAVKKGDDDRIALSAKRHINACYSNMNRVNRLAVNDELPNFYRDEGLFTADIALSYLDHEKFLRLKSDEAKEAILLLSRFYLALYDTRFTTDEETNEKRLQGLFDSIALMDDPFFRENAPNYDFDYHYLRTCEHMGQLTENANQWKMTPSQCERIMTEQKRMKAFWEDNEERADKVLPRMQMELLFLRNSYYSGRIAAPEYRNGLFSLYSRYANSKYDMYSIVANLFIPAEFIATMKDGGTLDDASSDSLMALYDYIASYILNSKNQDSYSFMIEYIAAFLERFVELPGKITFEGMALTCMAALAPNLYIHSLSVASLSKETAEIILQYRPSLFCDLTEERADNMPDEEQKRLRVLSFHSGLCHDIGKLPMIDTAITFGRELLQKEKELLLTHTAVGFSMLGQFDSTREFATASKQHHDDLSKDDSIISRIVAFSDALDHFCRNIKAGTDDKASYDWANFIKENEGILHEEILSIIRDPEVQDRLSFLLLHKKNKYLENTYELLKNVRDNSTQDLHNRLEGFILRTERIRELSAPQLSDISKPSEYGILLRQHFKEIGMMATENRLLLEKTVYPMIDSPESIPDTERAELLTFVQSLVNGQDLSDLDQSLVYRITKRLLSDADEKDPSYLVTLLDIYISTCYEMMHQTKRMKSAGELIKTYREEGLKAAERIWGFLDHERFLSLDHNARKLVLINARYAVYLYETAYDEPGVNELFLSKLHFALSLSSDPFFSENAPDYDWKYHTIRTYEYIGQSTECGNSRNFSKELVSMIDADMEEFLKLWREDRERSNEILPFCNLMLLYLRNHYFSGKLSDEEYLFELRKLYYEHRSESYDFNSVFPSVLVPLEMLITYESMDRKALLSDPEKIQEIEDIYRWVLRYVFHAKNQEAFSLLLEYFSEIMYHFIELEGGMTFSEMGLSCMAALHPPTYIHSRMVGLLSKAICGFLIDNDPKALCGVLGTKTADDVISRREEIIDHCYKGALYHDFGKIPMIDTIFVYGRKLLDSEFFLLKHHPVVGAKLLSMHDSTKSYSDIAMGHHLFYDGTKGYPAGFDTSKSPDKPLIDIVTAADCLDAATDTVGRSYSSGKRTIDILREIKEEKGTRYSPNIAAILYIPGVADEIDLILTVERGKNYSDAFNFIKGFLNEE